MRSRIDRNGGVNGAWCRGERHRLTDWLRVPASVVWLPLSSADLAEWCVHPFIPLRPRRTIQGPLQFSIPNRRHDEGRGRPFVYHAARLGAPFPRDSIAAPPFNAGIKVSLPIFRLFTATAATIAHVRLCWQCVGQAIALRTEGGVEGGERREAWMLIDGFCCFRRSERRGAENCFGGSVDWNWRLLYSSLSLSLVIDII